MKNKPSLSHSVAQLNKLEQVNRTGDAGVPKTETREMSQTHKASETRELASIEDDGRVLTRSEFFGLAELPPENE